MLAQGMLRTKGHEEMISGGHRQMVIADMVLNTFIFQNNRIFLGKFLKLSDQLTRMYHVQNKNTEEHSDKKENARFLDSHPSAFRIWGWIRK